MPVTREMKEQLCQEVVDLAVKFLNYRNHEPLFSFEKEMKTLGRPNYNVYVRNAQVDDNDKIAILVMPVLSNTAIVINITYIRLSEIENTLFAQIREIESILSNYAEFYVKNKQ